MLVMQSCFIARSLSDSEELVLCAEVGHITDKKLYTSQCQRSEPGVKVRPSLNFQRFASYRASLSYRYKRSSLCRFVIGHLASVDVKQHQSEL